MNNAVTDTPDNSENTGENQKASGQLIVKLLKVLVAFAAIYTLYFAQSLLLPLVFAILISLLLSPLVKRLKRIHIPRSISAIVLLATLVTPFTLMSIELTEPIQRWIKLVPKVSMQIKQELLEIETLFAHQNEAEIQAKEESFFSGWFGEEEQTEVDEEDGVVEKQIKQGGLNALVSMLAGTPIFFAQLFTSLILILFLLIFGPPLFSVFVNEFPAVENKRKARALVKEIQQALSSYIVTVSLINLGLGIVTAIALAFFGVDDALLWGVLVAFLNFVPYLGPAFGLFILLIVGGVQFGMSPYAFLPSAIFLVINIMESQFITPAILGQNMQVNPLIIILWLLLAGWLWGVVGVLVAVPLLVCIKLTLHNLGVVPHWIKFIEANESDLIR
uniref:AI-2E family transporter n=1 Tax=Ningiella ruwaisensis TaxID=2364274 RepID=UPI00109EED70|nr:AI-2E family transporter [Ningiella ruwaisensis]